jgi:hypothetical protein
MVGVAEVLGEHIGHGQADGRADQVRECRRPPLVPQRQPDLLRLTDIPVQIFDSFRRSA